MAIPSEADHVSKATHSPKRGHEQEEQSSSEAQQSTTNQSENPPLPVGEDPPLPEGEEPPPLPTDEIPPPLPSEAAPGTEPGDDGWDPVWDENTQAYYFHNRITGATQWENPRVPEATTESAPRKRPHGGYDPAIHGDYDPNASYAVEAREEEKAAQPAVVAGPQSTETDYSASGHFNRFTGKWQSESLRAENYSDEAKSTRQMNAFFDVDAAANSHNGKSLRAERANKKLSKQELKVFKEKRKEKKEEKRRAWLRD